MANDFGKRQQCKKAIRRDSNGKPVAVAFEFRHGDSVECRLGDVSTDMIVELAAHGIKQKVGDEGARETVTTPEEFASAARKMVERIYDGSAFERQASGGFGETDLAKAIAEFRNVTVEVATEFLKSLDAGAKAKLKTHAPIKAILDRLMAGRASDVDAEDLLSGLETKE